MVLLILVNTNIILLRKKKFSVLFSKLATYTERKNEGLTQERL